MSVETPAPAPARTPETTPDRAPAACVACAFVAESIARRAFYIFAEDLAEGWFQASMRQGGFCVRHGRLLAQRDDAFRLAGSYCDVIAGWRERAASGGPGDLTLGRACPVCTTETWAHGHVTALLVKPDGRQAMVTLGAVEPLCLQHLDRLLEAVAWSRVGIIVDQIVARLASASAAATLRDLLAVVCGVEPDAAPRTPVQSSAGNGVRPALPRAGGVIDVTGLWEELEAGRCPACSAADAGARGVFAWLAEHANGRDDLRDLDRLCPAHLWDAAAFAPSILPLVLGASLGRWTGAVPELLLDGRLLRSPIADRIVDALRGGTGPSGTVGAAGRGGPHGTPKRVRDAIRAALFPSRVVGERVATVRIRRVRPCVACEAMITARDRTLALLGALLESSSARTRYEATGGICLRHVAHAVGRLQLSVSGVVLGTAQARAARTLWSLDEALRKSSWSVRYEPRGPEGTAWRTALAFALGEPVLATGCLASEPVQARWSA